LENLKERNYAEDLGVDGGGGGESIINNLKVAVNWILVNMETNISAPSFSARIELRRVSYTSSKTSLPVRHALRSQTYEVKSCVFNKISGMTILVPTICGKYNIATF
jgi:hypothetical protein